MIIPSPPPPPRLKKLEDKKKDISYKNFHFFCCSSMCSYGLFSIYFLWNLLKLLGLGKIDLEENTCHRHLCSIENEHSLQRSMCCLVQQKWPPNMSPLHPTNRSSLSKETLRIYYTPLHLVAPPLLPSWSTPLPWNNNPICQHQLPHQPHFTWCKLRLSTTCKKIYLFFSFITSIN